MGDMTAHGGTLVAGCPTVLIGGVPAARLGDMHVCPMMNPGPSPHVGGPAALGSPMVLIGGMPAARMGDMLTCAGPPDTIAMGCMTVLVGEGGSSAGGGGAGASAAAAAQASAAAAQFDNNESTIAEEHWVVFEFVDSAGNPVSGVPYKFTDPDGNESFGNLRLDGKIRRDGISEGQCEVQLYGVSNAKWSKTEANVGEKVKLSAEVEGFEDGTPATFEIYRRDLKGADTSVEVIHVKVQGGKVEEEWEYVLPEDDDAENVAAEETPEYSAPQYYFDVILKQCKARSGLLDYKDWIEFQLINNDGSPIKNHNYILYFKNGKVVKGKLDNDGKAEIQKTIPGKYYVLFPD